MHRPMTNRNANGARRDLCQIWQAHCRCNETPPAKLNKVSAKANSVGYHHEQDQTIAKAITMVITTPYKR